MQALLIFGIIAFLSPVETSKSEQPFTPRIVQAQEVSVETASTSVFDLIDKYALKYGVSSTSLYRTIACETGNTFDPLIQSFIIKNGVREDSWGLAQWFLPAQNKKENGAVITKEDALNPDIALSTMAWYFATNRANKWSCFK